MEELVKETKAVRDNKGRYLKGNCGWAVGNPAMARVLKLKAEFGKNITKKRLVEVINNLLEIATQNKNPNAAIKAAEVIFDRLWGKARQEIQIEEKVTEVTQTPEDLRLEFNKLFRNEN